MDFTATVLLASIDEALAATRAALAAANDPEQLDEAKTELAARVGSLVARLVYVARNEPWEGVPQTVLDGIAAVEPAVHANDLQGIERQLADTREHLGGRSS